MSPPNVVSSSIASPETPPSGAVHFRSPMRGAGAGHDRRTRDRSFRDDVTELFGSQFPRVFRFVQRLTGEPDLAADLAQETFVRLYRRGSLPDAPASWLITVALNLLRNATATRSRRRRLLTASRAELVLADPPPSPARGVTATETEARVRSALDQLSERDRRMLLLCAEGYRYREIAASLGVHDASVGTLLARAKRAFRTAYREAEGEGKGEDTDAPR